CDNPGRTEQESRVLAKVSKHATPPPSHRHTPDTYSVPDLGFLICAVFAQTNQIDVHPASDQSLCRTARPCIVRTEGKQHLYHALCTKMRYGRAVRLVLCGRADLRNTAQSCVCSFSRHVYT